MMRADVRRKRKTDLAATIPTRHFWYGMFRQYPANCQNALQRLVHMHVTRNYRMPFLRACAWQPNQMTNQKSSLFFSSIHSFQRMRSQLSVRNSYFHAPITWAQPCAIIDANIPFERCQFDQCVSAVLAETKCQKCTLNYATNTLVLCLRF